MENGLRKGQTWTLKEQSGDVPERNAKELGLGRQGLVEVERSGWNSVNLTSLGDESERE